MNAPSRGALVLDAQSRAGLACVQSLGRAGIPVDAAAESSFLAERSRWCRHALRQPRSSDPASFARWIAEVSEANAYALVVPATEVSLRGIMSLPETHAPRRAAILPSNESLEIALSKPRTWDLARELDVPVPRSRILDARDAPTEPESFPVVLKPARTLVAIGSRFVSLSAIQARNLEAWREGLTKLLPHGPVLEQEFVPGGGVGIECLYREGSMLWHFQHERLHEVPLTGGGSSYRRSALTDERLLAEAERLLDRLRWHGVAMVEFKGSPDRHALMEINPRLWGSLPLTIAAGVDVPRGLWSVATGSDPGPQPAVRVPRYARNLDLDLDWMKENLRADHGDPLLLTRPRLRSLLECARPLLGVEVWDHFDPADRRVAVAILAGAVKKVVGTAFTTWQRPEGSHVSRHRDLLRRFPGNGSARIGRVLFVCYGNVCRSPLAERYARRLLPGLETASSGFHDKVDRTAPSWYRALANELGVDLSGSRSRRLDRAQVDWADLILLADLENLARFQREFPDAVSKATLLGLFADPPRSSIADPFGQDSYAARVTMRNVMAAVEGFARWSAPAQ